MTTSAARLHNHPAFLLFWNAYPKRIAPTEAERAFTEVVSAGADPEYIVQKARAYAASVDPLDLKFVPSPHSWLRAGRYDDQDLFTNALEAEKNWLRAQWVTANVQAVEDRFHVTFEKTYPPEDLTDPAAIKLWFREKARAWITSVKDERVAGGQGAGA